MKLLSSEVRAEYKGREWSLRIDNQSGHAALRELTRPTGSKFRSWSISYKKLPRVGFPKPSASLIKSIVDQNKLV